MLVLALMAAARPDKEAKILSQVYNLREDQSFDQRYVLHIEGDYQKGLNIVRF